MKGGKEEVGTEGRMDGTDHLETVVWLLFMVACIERADIVDISMHRKGTTQRLVQAARQAFSFSLHPDSGKQVRPERSRMGKRRGLRLLCLKRRRSVQWGFRDEGEDFLQRGQGNIWTFLGNF